MRDFSLYWLGRILQILSTLFPFQSSNYVRIVNMDRRDRLVLLQFDFFLFYLFYVLFHWLGELSLHKLLFVGLTLQVGIFYFA